MSKHLAKDPSTSRHGGRTSAQPGFVAVFVALLMLALTPRAHAETKFVASLSVSSLQNMEDMAKELGTNLPAWLTKEGLQGALRMSRDGIQTNAPVAIYLLGGSVAPMQRRIIAVPVAKGAAPLGRFIDLGARPMQGRNDTVLWGGFPIKRTPNYLIAGGTPSTIDRVNEKTMRSLYRSRSGLMRVQGDMKGIRQVMGREVNGLLNLIDGGARLQGQTMSLFVKPLTKMVRKDIDFADVQLDRLANDYRVSMTLKGLKPWKLGNFRKPRFGGSAVARLDVVYGDSELGKWPTEFLERLLVAMVADRALTAADRDAIKPILDTAADLMLIGDAVSAGVNEVDGKPVLFIVQQRKQPADAKAAVAKIVAHAESMVSGNPDARFLVDLSYKTKAGDDVHRLHLLENGKPVFYIDVAQHQRSTVLSFSQEPARHMEAMLPLRTSSTMRTGVSMEIDLPRLVKAMHALKDGPLAAADPGEVNKLAGKLARKSIRFNLSFKRDETILEATLPVKFLSLIDDIEALSK